MDLIFLMLTLLADGSAINEVSNEGGRSLEEGERHVCSPVPVPVLTACAGLGLVDFNKQQPIKNLFREPPGHMGL